jgi:hypothetical protein
MRKVRLNSCLGLAACTCLLASIAGCARPGLSRPGAPAGDEHTTMRLGQQWRIFPRAPFQRPADEEITARLTRQIDSLVALFQADGSNVPPETLGDSLIDGNARNQLFRLESLLRLYARAFPDLEKYRREVKELEDGLGAYSFTADSLSFAEDKFKKENQAQAPDAARKAEQKNVLEGLEKKKATARVVFAKLVERSTLGSDLPELRSVVRSSLTGWGPSKDLAFVNRELDRVLKNVRDGHFDFNKLEDGIHEFRRRLRWFPMLIDSLDGLILVRDDPPGACPVPALEALAGSAAAKNRYANPALRFPATHPCTISRCLLWQVSKTVRDIGRIKDEAEGNAAVESALDDVDIDVTSSNKATPEEIARANAIRTELFASRALDRLMAQVSSCKPS